MKPEQIKSKLRELEKKINEEEDFNKRKKLIEELKNWEGYWKINQTLGDEN